MTTKMPVLALRAGIVLTETAPYSLLLCGGNKYPLLGEYRLSTPRPAFLLSGARGSIPAHLPTNCRQQELSNLDLGRCLPSIFVLSLAKSKWLARILSVSTPTKRVDCIVVTYSKLHPDLD